MPIPISTTNAETARQRISINRTSRTCSAARLLPLDLAPGVGWVLTPAGCSHPKAAPPRSRSRRRAQNHTSPKVEASLAAALSTRHKLGPVGYSRLLGAPAASPTSQLNPGVTEQRRVQAAAARFCCQVAAVHKMASLQ